MADVITRFKLETTQYDSKLRDASKGLAEYTRQATQAGNEFGKFTQKNVEAARALGSITPSATNAKDKVKELTAAFNDTARAYNALTKEQQQSDFGKAMAESIGKLKDQLREAKQELYGMGDAMEKAKGGLFSGMGDKMSGMLQVFGGNLLAEGVSKLTSELAGSVQESIELARQGEGIRIAFERLNKPGLLDELKAATHGTVSEIELMKQAIKFENFKLPVEDLANYLAFAQQKAKDTGESIDYLVNSIVTGLGRQSKQILDNLGISAAELKSRMNEGATMTQAVSDIIREEMAKAGDYVETAADRAARATADTQNKMEELGRSAMPVAEEFSTAWNEIRNGAMTVVLPVLSAIADSIRDIRKILGGEWDMPTLKGGVQNLAEGSNIDDNGNFIRKPSNGNWAGFNANTGHYYDEIASMPEISVTGSAPKKKSGRSSTKTDPSAKIFQQFDTAMLKSAIGAESLKPEEVFGPSDIWKAYTEDIRSGLQGVDDEMSNLTTWTKDFDPYKKKMQELATAAQQQQQAYAMAASAVQNLGSAFASIEDPAAKAAGTVIQAIASIALGFAQASVQAAGMGPWGWVAFLAAGAAAMATTISTVHSLTGYANGGVVKGSSYSGDNIPALVDGSELVGLNAGEVVLNAAQQSNVAQSLQGAGLQNLNLTATVRGEDIKLALNNNSRRTGKGEYITTNFR